MDRRDLPSLDDLRAFETVARLGSVRAASAALHLTHGAVSRRIAKLSSDTGLPLFVPQGRGLRLTAEGSALAQVSTEALASVERVLSDLKRKTDEGVVTLSCERSIAMRWLIPRLASFQRDNPDITVNLLVGGGPLDFARENVSIALRRLDFPTLPDWSVTPLMAEAVGPVMVPEMVLRYRSGDYVALTPKTRSNSWSRWLEQHPDQPRPRDTRAFDHHFLILEASLAGLGVAMSPRILAIDDLERGRLVAPSGFSPDGSEYGLIRRASSTRQPSVEKVTEWLKSTMASPTKSTASGREW